MQVEIRLKLPATVKKKRGWFVSCCPVLDVCSQGETKEKALENLVEAIRLFLISCYERGTLEDVLRDCGFEPIEKKTIRIKPFSKRYESIDVPLPFQIKHKNGTHRCHV